MNVDIHADTHTYAYLRTHIYVQKCKHITYLSLGFLIPKESSTSTRLVLKPNKNFFKVLKETLFAQNHRAKI